MSAYVGIDLSTHNVDLVKLDEESDRAEWVRVPLVGENAIDRARYWCEGRHWAEVDNEWWDDVILCALENPGGRGDLRKIARVQGVVIATIPARVQCWVLEPKEWRARCGLKGNASKEQVAMFATKLRLEQAGRDGLRGIRVWEQDACDAYCIACAARAINQTQEDAAA